MKKIMFLFLIFSTYGKPRKTPGPRVNFNINKPRQAQVEKSNLKAFGANACKTDHFNKS